MWKRKTQGRLNMADSTNAQRVTDEVDVALIGGGIMSATLGAMLRTLEPSWSQVLFERLDAPAQESSSPWNNAGTGHSALCELNYTPEVNGRIEINKALGVNEKFQVSRQFWSYQINQGVLPNPREWINPVPHVSFARGESQVSYLKKRYDALASHPLFPNMQYTDDRSVFNEMLPLMADGRSEFEKSRFPGPMPALILTMGLRLASSSKLPRLMAPISVMDMRSKTLPAIVVNGRSKSKTFIPEIFRLFVPTLFLWALEEWHFRFSRSLESQKYVVGAVSRYRVNGCAVLTRKSSSNTRRKFMAKHLSVRPRCQYRTWIPALLMGKKACCLVLMRDGHQNS